MRKTLLIARREYLAFVRTIGFWLSIVTAPLIFGLIIAVPMLIRTTAPVESIRVAILDLSGGIEQPLREVIERETTAKIPDPSEGGNAALRGAASAMFDKDDIRVVALPPGLNSTMSLAQAEAAIPAVLAAPDVSATTIVVAHDDGEQLKFRIWSQKDQRGKLAAALPWQLEALQIHKLARDNGISDDVARALRDGRAEVISLSPGYDPTADREEDVVEKFREHGPRIIGAILGYVAWMTIFSSSMILLSGVIEEKSSKVLEVLLASASTESLLIGKVLGVAGVLATVGAIWGGVGLALASNGAAYLPPDVARILTEGLSGMFTVQHVLLLITYFIGGYLMFGVTFAAIGAFCETQKDAQAIMGPLMIVLMIPLLSMQAAFIAPNSPLIQWLSWVPIFSPFLMPLRLSGPLPWWEIVLTLGGMAIAATIMVSLGRRAFRQGALTGGKLSWGTLARIASRKAM